MLLIVLLPQVYIRSATLHLYHLMKSSIALQGRSRSSEEMQFLKYDGASEASRRDRTLTATFETAVSVV